MKMLLKQGIDAVLQGQARFWLSQSLVSESQGLNVFCVRVKG